MKTFLTAILISIPVWASNCWEMTSNQAALVEVPSNAEPVPQALDSLVPRKFSTSIAMVRRGGHPDDCGYKGGTTNADPRYPTGATYAGIAFDVFVTPSRHHAPRSNYFLKGAATSSRYQFQQIDDSNGNPLCSLDDQDLVERWFYKVCLDEDGQ